MIKLKTCGGYIVEIRTSDKFQIGKAGEYMVCADLLLKGLNVSPAGETLPYDLLLDTGSKILKIQVKTTKNSKRTNQWKGVNDAYVFSVRRKGSDGKKRYDYNEVDIFAVVTLDTKQIGYIKNSEMPTTINIRVDRLKGNYHDEKSIIIYDKVIKLKEEGLKSTLILQVHDELILNVYKDELKKVENLVKEQMENVIKLSVPLEVEISIGETWYEAK